MATSKTKTKKTTANSTAAKKTTATKKPKIKATPKPKSRTKKTKKTVQAAAVQTAVSAPVTETPIRTSSEAVRFESRNPLDYFLRLDVLIALALFFLLVTTVISFTVMQQELGEAQQAIKQLEEIVYGE